MSRRAGSGKAAKNAAQQGSATRRDEHRTPHSDEGRRRLSKAGARDGRYPQPATEGGEIAGSGTAAAESVGVR